MKAIAILFIVLALVIGVVPQLTNCSASGRALELANGRTAPMKCYWTARAELALAIPLLAAGALIFFSRRRDVLRSLAVVGAMLGAGALLLPTSLIGVCAGAEMSCNLIMKPTLVFSGLLAIGAGLAGLLLAGRLGRSLIPGDPGLD